MNNSWHMLVIDGDENDGEEDGEAGVTTLSRGRKFVGRREFRSIQAARVHVRSLIDNDSSGLFRFVVDLSLGLCYDIVDHLTVTRQTYLARGPGAWE